MDFPIRDAPLPECPAAIAGLASIANRHNLCSDYRGAYIVIDRRVPKNMADRILDIGRFQSDRIPLLIQ